MKPILTILSLMAATSAMATPLTPSQALGRIENQIPVSRSFEPALVAQSTGYYVFQTGETTYAIASADDCAQPLLATFNAPEFNLEALPPNMKAWLNNYDKQIAWGRDNNSPAWMPSVTSRAGKESVEPLIKCMWNQHAPWNNNCPEVDGDKCLAGCVALAMAQIMKYHQWPDQGKGSNSYTSRSLGLKLSMDFSELKINWDDITYEYAWYSTLKQKKAVAAYVYACGVAVNMDYGVGASGAYNADVVPAIINNFSYDPWATNLDREYFTDAQWSQMVYDELSGKRPVYYSGDDPEEGGHAFVVDGYDSETDMYHFVWGWSNKAYDGYYTLESMPTDHGNFCHDQAMIINFMKPQEWATDPWIVVATNGLSGTIDKGVAKIYPYRNPTEAQYAVFANLTTPTLRASMGLELVNQATNESKYVESYASGRYPQYYGEDNLKLNLANVEDGTYDVYPAYSPEGEQGFRRMGVNSDVDNHMVLVKDGANSSISTVSEYAANVKYQWEDCGTALFDGGGITVKIKSTASEYTPTVAISQSSTTPGMYLIKGAFGEFYTQNYANSTRYKYYPNYDIMLINATNPNKAYLEGCSTGIMLDGANYDYMYDYTSTVYNQMMNGEDVTESMYGTFDNNTLTFPAKSGDISSIIFFRNGKATMINEDGTFKIQINENSGVNNVMDNATPIEWFNLQGIKVANPQNGIFIKRQGQNVKKVTVGSAL